MKVAVIGATGHVGSVLTAEAVLRGHSVIAVSRTGSAPVAGNVTGVGVDIASVPDLTAAIAGSDVVIHAFNPGRGRIGREVYDAFIEGHHAILNAVRAAGVSRLLCVGGAGSLLTRDGVELVDSPEWPPEFADYKDGVRGTRALYYLLRETQGFDWVFLSPPNLLTPGPRTGAYRVGTDRLLYDADGQSHIALADFACAMIDELERPVHHRQRFTVGY